MNSKLLKFSLLFGCLYFVCMSIAHFFSIKVPILFVYFDTEYFAYQDKIISFAVTAYIALFYLASKDRKNVPAALIVLGITTLGLTSINLSSQLKVAMTSGQTLLPYWLETAFIASYLVVLTVLYKIDGKRIK
jgi:hypothetical protein